MSDFLNNKWSMPKKRQDATTRSTAPVKSDAELEREKWRANQFETGDLVLGLLGWGLWMSAGAWFLFFSAAVPEIETLRYSGIDPFLSLVVCAVFCRALTHTARKAWPMWRIYWHITWIFALGVVSYHFFQTSKEKTAPPHCFAVAVGASCAALGALWSCPRIPSAPAGSPSDGRRIVFVDGVAGVVCSGWIFVVGPLQRENGLVATIACAVPLAMVSLGVAMCSSKAEVLTAVPVVMLFLVGIAIRTLANGAITPCLLATCALLGHAVLYLPPADGKINPFYESLRRVFRDVRKLFDKPIAGFQDEGD